MKHRPAPTRRQKILSSIMCVALAWATMFILDKAQAHASLPPVGASPTSTACGMFTYPCPPPNPFPIPTQPLPVQVKHWYPVQTHFYYSGPWLHAYVSHAQSVRLSGFALQGAGLFAARFCSHIPVIIGQAFCGVAVAAYFYQLRAAFVSAASHGRCVRVFTMWPAFNYVSDTTTTCQRVLR